MILAQEVKDLSKKKKKDKGESWENCETEKPKPLQTRNKTMN